MEEVRGRIAMRLYADCCSFPAELMTQELSRLWRDWAQPRKGGIFDMLRPYGTWAHFSDHFRGDNRMKQAWTTAAHETKPSGKDS